VNPTPPSVLAVNGGSSSIKFALFEVNNVPRRILEGRIEGIGLREGSLKVKASDPSDNLDQRVAAPNRTTAVNLLMDWANTRIESGTLSCVGHRVVHGGPKYWEPQRITPDLIKELHQLSAFDPEHLPEEILLIEAFQHRFPELPQVACFDTAFHHDLPRVARQLPIPRRYEAKGVRRYGFHGLSCAYLIEELARVDAQVVNGRVILAHLGSGASITAVRDAQSVDTSMGFTPSAGLPMSTRSGDLDPGLVWFLARTEKLDAKQWNELINSQSGLLGVSETSSDVRDLLAREAEDVRAAEAIAMFCYQIKKWIGAYAAALGGLDALVFSGGIGEHSAPVRARACDGLEFLGIEIDEKRNLANKNVISTEGSPVAVHVIPTDEESMIARTVCRVQGFDSGKEDFYEQTKR